MLNRNPTDKEYLFMKTMVKYSDSEYPEFWTVPIGFTAAIMFGILFGPFMGWPLLLIPISGAGLWTLLTYQRKAYDMIHEFPHDVYTQIHNDLKKEKEADYGR